MGQAREKGLCILRRIAAREVLHIRKSFPVVIDTDPNLPDRNIARRPDVIRLTAGILRKRIPS